MKKMHLEVVNIRTQIVLCRCDGKFSSAEKAIEICKDFVESKFRFKPGSFTINVTPIE